VWLARQDIAKKKGFRPSTHQIGVFASPLTDEEIKRVRAECLRLQKEMYAFAENKPKVFGGTWLALISEYQTDRDSPYQTARYSSRKNFDHFATKIAGKIGATKLADTGARDFKKLYEDIRWPEGKDGPDRVSSAYHAITYVRMMLTFGTTFEIEKLPREQSHCARLRVILSDLDFENVKARTETLTLRQSEDIAKFADADGHSSIALTQVMMRHLGLRQKDVIGEWVPVKEPGISDVTWHGRKWMRGIRLEEISSGLILTHAMSKSRTGKVLEFDLNAYPEVAERVRAIMATRSRGPLVICERTGRPWKQNHFRQVWRTFAGKASVPKHIQNRDSRAGAITEVITATNGNLEAARKMAGHSDIRTTQGYSREQLETNRKTAAVVAEFRAKNGA
jgi:integrase